MIEMTRQIPAVRSQTQASVSLYSVLLVLVGIALGMPELLTSWKDSPFFVPARLISVLLVLQILTSRWSEVRFRFPTETLLIWLIFTIGVLATVLGFVVDSGDLRVFMLIAGQQLFNVVVLTFIVHALLTRGGIKPLMLGLLIGGFLQLALYFLYQDAALFSSISGRYKGFFVNPNSLAAYLVLAYISALYFTVLLRDIRGLLILVAFLPVILVMDATASRLGLVMLVGVTLIFLMKVWPRQLLVALPVMACLLLIPGTGQEIVADLIEESQSIQRYERKLNSIDSVARVDLWQGGVNGIKETFPIGAGIGQTLDIQNFYRWMSGVNITFADERLGRGEGLSMHNTYITLLLEYGFVPFLLYLFLIMKLSLDAIRKFIAPGVSASKILMILLVFDVAVASLAQNGFLNLLFWYSIAVVIALSYESPDTDASEPALQTA